MTYTLTIKIADTAVSGTVIPVSAMILTYDDLPPFSAGNFAQSQPAQIRIGEMAVYPNPFNPKKAVGGVMKFGNMPLRSSISIYTLNGELVLNFYARESRVTWDGRNAERRWVSPGVYYYIIRYNESKSIATGKIYLVND